MSLNIQTADGKLLEIGGKVTKEKITEALGYEPANKTHTTDETAHVTSAEKETWNNKSDVKHYDDLEGAPNITENDSGSMVIADNNGNIIMQVDENGLTTTDINVKTVNLNGKDLGVRLDELEATSLPNILDNETGDLTIADENGNTIMKVNADGLETTTVTSKSLVVNGVNVENRLDSHKEDIDDLIDHAGNTEIHIDPDERILWNNKSEFSGDFNDLTNAPDIKEDNSGEVVYSDEDGNVIAKIGETGFETTQVTANTVFAGGENVGSHITNKTIHITDGERTIWNEKADKVYVDNAVAALVNSAPEQLNTLDELAAALGDDENFATTVTNQIASKVSQVDFDKHTHTKSQVGLGNVDNTSDANKPVSTAQREALNELKSELSETIVSEAKEWIVADDDGNIIAKVDTNGFKTTTVTADAVVVNGKDLQTTLNGKSDSEHTHSQYLEAEDIADKVDKSYVDTAIKEVETSTSNKDAVILSEAQKGILATQDALNEHTTDTSNPHNVTKAQVGLSNVDNTSDVNKPVSIAQQAALDTLKSELSESIVSESREWTVTDEDGNVVARIDMNGFETTDVTAKNIVVNGIDVGEALEDIDKKLDKNLGTEESGKFLTVDENGDVVTTEMSSGNSYGSVSIPTADGAGRISLPAQSKEDELRLEAGENITLTSGYAFGEDGLTDNVITISADTANKADKSYVDSEIAEAKLDASNKDAVVLSETQKGISELRTYVDSNKEKTANKVTTISSSSTNTKYPSAKAVYDFVNDLVGDVQSVINSINTIIG